MFEREFQRGMKSNFMKYVVINTIKHCKTLDFDQKNDLTYLMAKILN